MENIITINTEETTKIDTENVLEQNKPFPIFDKNNPLLKQIMPKYTGEIENPKFQEFIRKLQFTRKAFRGIGLAANQCGIEVRVFVIGTEAFDMVCINPEILEVSEEVEKGDEGCLSFPFIYLKIKRPKKIKVKYSNQLGELIEVELIGMTARCFQHEMDHLNGISIIDHVGKTSMMMAEKKRDKIMKRLKRQGK